MLENGNVRLQPPRRRLAEMPGFFLAIFVTVLLLTLMAFKETWAGDGTVRLSVHEAIQQVSVSREHAREALVSLAMQASAIIECVQAAAKDTSRTDLQRDAQNLLVHMRKGLEPR